jgi:protein-disulfide isomerase
MGRKGLVVFTLMIAAIAFSGAVYFSRPSPPSKASFHIEGVPMMGQAKAPIEVILIEDFQCRNCREFSQKIIPKLQAEYVRSGKVRFVLVPVSFLAGSQLVANATLEVFKQNPGQFFSYLKEILHYDGDIKTSDLIRLARRVGGIDLAKLQTCIEQGCHQQELAKNLAWAQGIMGAQFRTPALYINGAVGSTYSFEAIQYQIDQILRKQ